MARFNNRTHLLAAAAALVCMAGLMLLGCRGHVGGKPVITVSIQPQRWLVQQLAGDAVQVVSLLGEGSNPETYEPNINDVMALEHSLVYMTVGGLGYESAIMTQVRSNMPDLPIVDTSHGIGRLPGHDAADTQGDPHVWTSVKNMRAMAANVHGALVQLMPKQQKKLDRNLASLTALLDSLDASFASRLQPLQGHSFVVWHPSLSYFARDYGLTQVALDNGKDPSAVQLRQRLDAARQSQATVLFLQKQYDGRQARALQQSAADGGIALVEINPMSEDWAGEMSRLVDALTAHQEE